MQPKWVSGWLLLLLVPSLWDQSLRVASCSLLSAAWTVLCGCVPSVKLPEASRGCLQEASGWCGSTGADSRSPPNTHTHTHTHTHSHTILILWTPPHRGPGEMNPLHLPTCTWTWQPSATGKEMFELGHMEQTTVKMLPGRTHQCSTFTWTLFTSVIPGRHTVQDGAEWWKQLVVGSLVTHSTRYLVSYTTVLDREPSIFPQEFFWFHMTRHALNVDVRCIGWHHSRNPFVYHAAQALAVLCISKQVPFLPAQPAEDSLKVLINAPMLFTCDTD